MSKDELRNQLADILDDEAPILREQALDAYTDALWRWHTYELQKAREEKQNILTVGWHKGEMDFGINCSIDELDIKQMHDFRVMVCVAIGQAENMWRMSREKQNPTTFTKDQSELDQPNN